MARLQGKVAIVTGAGRSIGKGIAIALAREGAKVVVASRTASTVDAVVKLIKDEGNTAIGVTVDVGMREQILAMVDQTVKAFGTVDILVNNAQSYTSPNTKVKPDGQQPIETHDQDDWDWVYRTGVLATLWGMQAVFPYMKDKGGKIINFGSAAAQIGIPMHAAYNAAKEGIRGLSRTAAKEWGKYGINVNVINPAAESDAVLELRKNQPEFMAQMTAMIPMGRWGDPIRDTGALAVFLSSPDSDYITGMTFMLDGGQFMFP